MARVRIVGGPFANFEGELLADEGDVLRVAVELFGRRTEVDLEREHAELPPLPPPPLPALCDALDELDRWMTAAAPAVRAAHGRTDEAELRALAALGPGARELVELYRRFGGTTDWQGFYRGCELVPLRSALSTREMMNGLEVEGTFYRWAPNEWWHPGWLPFLDNHSYDMYCVDLVGTMGGAPGQIVQWSKDSAARPVVAPSLGAWLGALLYARDAGAYVWGDDEGIGVADGQHAREHRALRRALPGYPKPTAARSRKEVEGAEPPPRPARRVEASGVDYAVTRQWWAPGSTAVHALAYLEGRGLLAVGQYDWGEAPGGLSLVDPASGDVVETVLGREQGSVLEMMARGGRLVVRRLRGSYNEVAIVGGAAVQVVRERLPTRMAAFVAAGDEHLAVDGGDDVEIVALAEPARVLRRLALPDGERVLGLSPDGRLLVVAQRDRPLRWYDVESGRRLGQTEGAVHAHAIELGLAGDVWVAGNRASQRFELATGRPLEHDASRAPFVVALHRPTRRVAFAGYGGTVTVLEAHGGRRLAEDSTHGGRVYGLAWSPDGTRLWSADEGGQIAERTLGPNGRVR